MTIEKQQVWNLAYACVGRRDDYAVQQSNGRYLRAGRALDYEALRLHLAGVQTIGTYVLDEQGSCHFAVFDADSDDGLYELLTVHRTLASAGIASYPEVSRRGMHLWVFLAHLTPAASLRRYLLPFCPSGIEFYPKRDWSTDEQPGSCIRLPFGIHRRSGLRYPFVTLAGDQLMPVAPTVAAALTWLSTVERIIVPQEPMSTQSSPAPTTTQPYSSKKAAATTRPVPAMMIREWCLQQDPVAVIGRYVDLNRNGLGCCPFGSHHANGKDQHPSLWVHASASPDIACWYCHTWRQGGSLFDFLSLYYGLSYSELWHRILSGEQF